MGLLESVSELLVTEWVVAVVCAFSVYLINRVLIPRYDDLMVKLWHEYDRLDVKNEGRIQTPKDGKIFDAPSGLRCILSGRALSNASVEHEHAADGSQEVKAAQTTCQESATSTGLAGTSDQPLVTENYKSLDLSDVPDDPVIASNYWLQSVSVAGKPITLNLLESDRLALMDDDWLNDKHINAAMRVLKVQFEHIGGWQDAIFYRKEMVPESRESIQLHYSGLHHWVTSTSIGRRVRLYDSLYDSIGPATRTQLTEIYALLADESGTIRVELSPCQLQQDEFDCGLFAVAFAVELAAGNDPSLASFDQPAMRAHFCSCLTKGHFQLFPKVTYKVTVKPGRMDSVQVSV